MTDPAVMLLAAVGGMALLVALFVSWISDRNARASAANIDRIRASLRQQLEAEGLGGGHVGASDGALHQTRVPDAAGTQ